MALAIEAVLPVRFQAWVTRRPFSVVFLGDGAKVARPRQAVEGLERLFPGQVALGWVARDAVVDAGWWIENWRTELGPYTRQGLPPEGVYLFHLGYIAGFHAGTVRQNDRATLMGVRNYLVERIRLKASIGAESTEWTRFTGRATQEEPARPPPPPRPAVALPGDPYAVLEVDPDASPEELKKAYRVALKLNHPDKVAHMSVAIQEFAKERTRRIVEAWQLISSARGLR